MSRSPTEPLAALRIKRMRLAVGLAAIVIAMGAYAVLGIKRDGSAESHDQSAVGQLLSRSDALLNPESVDATVASQDDDRRELAPIDARAFHVSLWRVPEPEVPEEATRVAAPPKRVRPTIIIVALTTDENGDWQAAIVDPEDTKIRLVKNGDAVGSMQVIRVDASGVAFDDAGEEFLAALPRVATERSPLDVLIRDDP